MGNLPVSRTVTANPSDPVSSALIDEIQDCSIGMKKPPFWRAFYPKFIFSSNFAGASVTIGGNLVVVYQSPGAAGSGTFEIPFEVGDRFIGLKYWAAGNGTADLTGTVSYWSAMSSAGTTIAAWADNNRAAAMGLVDVTATSASPAFTNQILADGSSLVASITGNALGCTIGEWYARFDRL